VARKNIGRRIGERPQWTRQKQRSLAGAPRRPWLGGELVEDRAVWLLIAPAAIHEMLQRGLHRQQFPGLLPERFDPGPGQRLTCRLGRFRSCHGPTISPICRQGQARSGSPFAPCQASVSCLHPFNAFQAIPALEVKDRSCNHCVQAIPRAWRAADQGAEVRIDLAAHGVEVEPRSADPALLAAAISAAGSTPQPL
jgi:copper chaperone CopZ